MSDNWNLVFCALFAARYTHSDKYFCPTTILKQITAFFPLQNQRIRGVCGVGGNVKCLGKVCIAIYEYVMICTYYSI